MLMARERGSVEEDGENRTSNVSYQILFVDLDWIVQNPVAWVGTAYAND